MNNEKIRPREGVDILIVEDSPTQAEELRYLLERENHRVRVALNGRLALAAVKESRPTLIITDVVMPEMDGYELCSTLKADPALKQIPVVIVTSLSGIQDIAKSLECGADNFIRKPYEQKALLARVEYILLNLELRQTSRLQMGMEIFMGGQKHFIASGREQIVDLLISTYEEAVHMNEEMKARQREIVRVNRTLRMLYRIATELNRGGSEAEVCERALLGLLELSELRAGWIDLDLGLATMRTFGTACPAEAPIAGASSPTTRLPLMVGAQNLGILNLVGVESGALSRDTLRMLDAVASQLAVAIQRAQLHEHLESLVVVRTTALEANQRRFVELFEFSPDALVMTNRDGFIVQVNRQAEALFGWSRTDLLGQPVEVLMPQQARAGHVGLRERFLPSTLPRSMNSGRSNLHGLRKDGTVFSVDISLSPLELDGDRVVIAAVRDISERERLDDALRQSAERFRHTLDNMLVLLCHKFNLRLTHLQCGQCPRAFESATLRR